MTRGDVANRISTLARDISADLIVMSTHGRAGVARLIRKNEAEQVVRLTGTPLLSIRPTQEWKSRQTQFKRLLVSLDGSRESEQVLRYARALAKRFESKILLLAVPEADSEIESMNAYLEQVAQALRGRGLNAQAMVTGSGPARTIVKVSESEQADLIMMATHGRGGAHRSIPVGSVADRVIQSTERPAFAVPCRTHQ